MGKNFKIPNSVPNKLSGAKLRHFERFLHWIFTLLLGLSLRETSVYFSGKGKLEVAQQANMKSKENW